MLKFIIILFSCFLPLVGLAATEQEKQAEEAVIKPQIERRNIKLPRIDSENFEVGAFTGLYTAEDFGSNLLLGVDFSYHITEDFFLSVVFGHTQVTDSAFSNFGLFLFPEREEDLFFYNLSLGYNLFPGEIFLGRSRALNSTLYVIGGLGISNFIDEDKFTANLGFGFRVLLTDWLAAHLDTRDHMFESDIVGEKKLTHNFTWHGGLTIFF